MLVVKEIVFPRNISIIPMKLLAGHCCILFIAGDRFLEGNIAVTIACSPWFMALDYAVSCSLLHKYVTAIGTLTHTNPVNINIELYCRHFMAKKCVGSG
jgi:hypothetical protein